MAYDIEQVKTVYGELTAKVRADLDDQFNKGRLKGTDYANVYSTLMNTCLQLSFQAPLNEEQTKLYERQRQGFDDNFKFKMFDSQINAWGIMYSSGVLTDKPSIVSNDEVSFIYNEIQDSLNLSKGFDFINIGYGELKSNTTINLKKDIGVAYFVIPLSYDEYSFKVVPSSTDIPNSAKTAFYYDVSKRDSYTSSFTIDLYEYSGLDVGDSVVVPEIVILYKKDGVQREKKITNIKVKIV